MNLQKYTKAAKICAVTVALLCSGSLAYAETVVHTTRHYRDSLNAAKNTADDAPLAEIKEKSQADTANNKPKKTRRPTPYNWEDALDYAMMYPEDITPHKIGGIKDRFGNFGKWLYLDFLGDAGLANRGDSFWGFADHTFLRLTVHFGQEINPQPPIAILTWGADINKLYKVYGKAPMVMSKFKPIAVNIVFESGYEKTLYTQPADAGSGRYLNFGFLYITVANYRCGNIELSNEDIWDIYRHGNIANVYLENGLGTGDVSFFYSGEKQEEHKAQLTYAFEHITRMLNINPATLAYERQKNKIATEKAYRENEKNKLKEEVKRDMTRKELLEEVKKEAQEEIKLGR